MVKFVHVHKFRFFIWLCWARFTASDAVIAGSMDWYATSDIQVASLSQTSLDSRSISLSHNGSTVAIGDENDETTRVYNWNGTDWSLMGDVLHHSDCSFGQSVSLSADGTTLAVGAPCSSTIGSAIVYEWKSTHWDPKVFTGSMPGSKFGYSVALSGDANVLAVGAPDMSSEGLTDNGAMDTYHRYTSTLWFGPFGRHGTDDGDHCGYSVSLSYNGTVIAAGCPGKEYTFDYYGNPFDFSSGAVITGEWNGTAWNQRGSWIDVSTVNMVNSGINADFGHSVALSGDGNSILIGAPKAGSNNSGFVSGLDWNDTTNDWTLVTNADVPWISQYGLSLGIAYDATPAVISGSADTVYSEVQFILKSY